MAVFTNQATLSFDGGSTISNIVTGEIVEVLSAAKTSVNGSYNGDDALTYVISIVNTGPTAFSNITVTDNLGEYSFGEATLVPLEYIDGSAKYFVNGVLQGNPTVTTDSNLAFSGITVPAGGNALIVYSARTNGFAPPIAGGTITNTAEITGSTLSSPITVTETVTASEESNLSISKALSPETVVENGQITYTLVVQNTGTAPAVTTDNLVISDTFAPILSDISVTYNGTPWSSPANYTYDETTGLITTVAGQITVPAATYTRNPETGIWSVTPGTAVIRVTGTV